MNTMDERKGERLKRMKSTTLSILEPGIRRIIGEEIKVLIGDNEDFLDAIAEIDEKYMKRPVRAKRGDVEIQSIMQFIWDPVNDVIFDDVGIESRDRERNWIPLKRELHVDIPDGTTVLITPEAGC